MMEKPQLGIMAINKHKVLLCELGIGVSFITLPRKPLMSPNLIISRIADEDTCFFIPIENRKNKKKILSILP